MYSWLRKIKRFEHRIDLNVYEFNHTHLTALSVMHLCNEYKYVIDSVFEGFERERGIN